jgi:hypothetical protein
MRILKYSRITYFFIVLMVLVSSLGLAEGQKRDSLMKQYRKAVEDARVAEPDEICRTLTAVVSFNKELVWRESNGQKQVLVVTWTRDYYNNQVGQTITTPRDIWVTVIPQLKDFCQALKLKEKALQLRLEQLLGLPPDNGKTMMVEIWVSPSDLFRPSPDPGITDHEAELDFPNSWFMSVAPPYIEWFYRLKAASYGKDGYPWTRLGYTYDWGNPGSEVGLSEFVIRSGASIGIHSAIPTAEYCQSH